MSYLFGTWGITFWKSGVKPNVLSLCLPASPREFPRRNSPAKRLAWIPTVPAEHCGAGIPGNGAAWGALEQEGREMGREQK